MPANPPPSSKLEKLRVFVLSPRNLRYNLAILAGAATIAMVNWLAMSQSNNALGDSMPVGGLIAPALGGLVTGAILAYSKRPAYMDGAAGTYAAFGGVLALIFIVVIARLTDSLPADGVGFEKFGPISLIFFFALVGGFNMAVCFPITFGLIFLVRTAMPGNEHKYGWVDDTDLEYVTPGPPSSAASNGQSTARSRFKPQPIRYSKIPARHQYRREE